MPAHPAPTRMSTIATIVSLFVLGSCAAAVHGEYLDGAAVAIDVSIRRDAESVDTARTADGPATDSAIVVTISPPSCSANDYVSAYHMLCCEGPINVRAECTAPHTFDCPAGSHRHDGADGIVLCGPTRAVAETGVPCGGATCSSP